MGCNVCTAQIKYDSKYIDCRGLYFDDLHWVCAQKVARLQICADPTAPGANQTMIADIQKYVIKYAPVYLVSEKYAENVTNGVLLQSKEMHLA